jgi:hypothetical protein
VIILDPAVVLHWLLYVSGVLISVSISLTIYRLSRDALEAI